MASAVRAAQPAAVTRYVAALRCASLPLSSAPPRNRAGASGAAGVVSAIVGAPSVVHARLEAIQIMAPLSFSLDYTTAQYPVP